MFVNSTNGKKLYNLSYGDPDSTQWEAGTDIELTSNGNYIITGYEYVDATQKRDLSLIYINENDNSTEFHYTFGGTLRDLGRSVKETSDNRFVVTGYSNNTDSNYYDGNLSLFIFDDTGSRLWENSLLYGGNNWTSGLSIDTTNDGGYIITGHTNYSETKYDYDLLLIKTNSQGSIDWTRRYDLGNYDTGWSVSQTSDGGFIIAGYNNLTSLNYSAWLLKTDEYGNFTYCINNQSLTKKIIELDPNNLTGLYLENGTIIGKINGDEVNYSQESLSNLSNYWHHIALTFNGSIIKFYINGSLVNTFENDTILNNKNLTTRIGQYFCGIIDEVKIWNRTLTNEEINSSYNCLLTGNYLNRNFTGLTERAYSYYYHAILANGSENSPTTRFVTVDQTAPSSSVNTISVFNQTGQEIALTVSATETLSGLNQTKIKWYNSTNNFNWNGPWYNNSFCVNNTPWIMSNSIFFSFNFTNANGTGYYRFYSIAKDNASNWEISPIQNDTQCYANTSNNFAPYASSTPSPSNGSTGISITADLSWRNNSDPDDTTNSEANLTYDIYFGTNSTPNAGDLKSRNQTTMTYDTGTLTNSITYYWMIITYDNHSIGTPSPIWSFTTVAAGDDDDDTQGPGDYTPPSDNEDDTNESADETTNQTNTTTDVSTVGNDGINETTPSINQTVEEIINLQNVTRNSTVEINFTKEEDLGLVNIKINPKINFTDFKISVRLKNDTDADLIKIEDTNFSIYKYLEINLSSNNSYIESKDINSSEIRFKVKKSWIENENINFSTISLMRLNNSTWVKLNTIWQNENQNETYYYFIAETPGFSTFAVVGSKVIETGEPSQYREPEIPWLIIFGFIISAIIILIVILVKAKYIYIEEEPIKEEKQKEE